MTLPEEPVTLNAEQIRELNARLATMRHDVNNNLSLMAAAVELIRHRPETTERMLDTLLEQPRKISAAIQQFSNEMETALGIKRP